MNFNHNHNSKANDYCNQITISFDFIVKELNYSIKHGHLSKVKSIIDQHGKDKIDEYWKVDNFDFLSPIHEAAESGHNSILKYLISTVGFNINELTSVFIFKYIFTVTLIVMLIIIYNILFISAWITYPSFSSLSRQSSYSSIYY